MGLFDAWGVRRLPFSALAKRVLQEYNPSRQTRGVLREIDVAKKRVEHQPPDVLAMVLADSVLHDLASGKFVIQGTYSVIMASAFPVIHPALAVYFAITNGHGMTPVAIRLIDVDEAREPIFALAGEVDFADPLQVVEHVFAARRVRFPEPGEYRLQLFAADQLLRERRLQVVPLH